MLKFQGKVTDTSGNPVAGARLTVTKTNVLSPLPVVYTISSDGSIFASANPFNSDPNGEYVFAVESGSYSIEATGASAVLNISKTITEFTQSASSTSDQPIYPFNRILNPFFYIGLSPWITSGTNPPLYSTLTMVSGTGSCEQTAQTPTPSSTDTKTGSVSQSFNIPILTNGVQLNFYSTIRTSNTVDNYSGYVKVYLYSGVTGIETLVGTVNYSIVANKQPSAIWELHGIDISAYAGTGGSFVVRFELSATATDTGGIVPVFAAVAIDDVYVLA